jgi:hypothetical protein
VSDRELLELAAKAAGYGEVWYSGGCSYIGPKPKFNKPIKYRTFNPLDDDGDALRLAVKLFDGHDMDVIWANARRLQAECPKLDKVAAYRYAITRAAAEIGAGLRPFPTAEEIREDWLGGT